MRACGVSPAVPAEETGGRLPQHTGAPENRGTAESDDLGGFVHAGS